MPKVKFTLRLDMPRGYKENAQYPELPALLSYLTPLDNQVFECLRDFKIKIFDGSKAYLKSQEIQEGADPKLRKGLRARELPDKITTGAGDVWDYMVLTPATNIPGICVFGGLEKIT